MGWLSWFKQLVFIVVVAFPGLHLHSLGADEDGFSETYQTVIYPNVKNNLKVSSFKNKKGNKVLWAYMPTKLAQSNGVIFLFQGRTESHLKYFEVIHDFSQNGFDIITIDWVGQGGSDHLSEYSSQYGHITDFLIYREDFEQLYSLREVRRLTKDKQLYVVAHSMGANIAAQFMLSRPGAIKKAVLSTPMLDIKTGPFSEGVAYFILQSLEFFGLGELKAPTAGEFRIDEPNLVTSSKARRDVFFKQRLKNSDYIIGPPTVSYGRAALEATWVVRENASKLTDPILMLQAGNDQIVNNFGQDEVCKLAKKCKLVRYPNAKHELLMESDVIRDDVFGKIFEFLSH